MTQSRTAGPYQSPPLRLLAEHARRALGEHPCCLCPRPVRRGERIADVVGGRGMAHVGCVRLLPPGEALCRMRGRRARRREAEAEAQRPVQCTGPCGRVFASAAAFRQAP